MKRRVDCIGLLRCAVVLAAIEVIPLVCMAMNSEERLLFANGLYRRNLYELAIPEYQALMTNEAALPMQDLAAFRLGECYRGLNRMKEASAAYDVVVNQYPDSLFMHRASFRRAEAEWMAGRLKDATTRFQSVLQKKPPDDIEAASLYYLGVSQAGIDRFADAEKNLRRMLRSHAASPYADYARMALVDLLNRQSDTEKEVVGLLEKIIKQPETPALGAEATAKAGLLSYHKRDMERASRLFTDLATHYPESDWLPRVRLESAWAHLLDHQQEKARVVAQVGLQSSTPAERPVWLYLLANIERRTQAVKEAQKYYDEFLALAPDHEFAGAAAYEACGLAYQSEEYERVLKLAELAKGSTEQEVVLLWMKAVAFKELDRFDDAKATFQAIVNQHPDSDRAPVAAYQLSLLIEETGDVAGAAASFASVADRYSKSSVAADAWMAAAAGYRRAGQPSEAINAWRKLISLHPEYPSLDEARMGCARAEAELQQNKEATANLQALMSIHTNSRFLAEANYLQGTIYETEEQFEEAEFHYRRALNHKPSPSLARQIQHRQVAVLQRQGRNEEAAGLMNKLLQEGGGNLLPSPLLEWLARWNLEKQKYQEAEMAARRLAETGESDGWKQIGYYIAGVAALELKNIQVAIDAFTAAAGYDLITRETADAYFQLGLMAMEQDKFEQAVEYFSQAADKSSTDAAMDIRARSYLQLGMAYEALEKWNEAGRYYLGGGVLFDDPELTPESLYRAAVALEAQQQASERVRILAELQERYPESEWNRRAGERWPK